MKLDTWYDRNMVEASGRELFRWDWNSLTRAKGPDEALFALTARGNRVVATQMTSDEQVAALGENDRIFAAPSIILDYPISEHA